MPHGAYVAKPDAAVAQYPSYEPPSGWDIDWPFPGPMPPGYEPEDPRFGCTLTGEDEIQVGNTYTPTFTLHEINSSQTWRTENPDTGTITWTATLDGSPLSFSLDGGASDYSATSSYEHIGLGWYGDEPDIVFDLTNDDKDKTIVLSVSSAGTMDSDSFSVSATKSITVTNVIKLILTQTLTVTEGSPDPVVTLNWSTGTLLAADSGDSVSEYGTGLMLRYVWPGVQDYWQYLNNQAGGVAVTNPSGSANVCKIEVEECEEDTYKIWTSSFCAIAGSNSSALELKVYKGETLDATYTKTVSHSIDPDPNSYRTVYDWVYVNGATGEVTLIDSTHRDPV